MFNSYLSRFVHEPIMIAAHGGDQFIAAWENFDKHMAQVEKAEASAKMQDDFWPEPDSRMALFRPYIVKDGILQIPVKGTLLHDFGYQLFDLYTGYPYIQKAVERGLADPEVKGIALVINSGGGMVAGNFDLVDRIYQARGQKPIRAFANEHAYSAAYSLASAADSISVARTGGLGSIGVVTMHVDMSKAVEKAGYQITFIDAPEDGNKTDGHPFAALPADVKQRIQDRINATYDIFVATVARNRGISEEAVRATKALTFTAAESVSMGLGDTVTSLDDSLAAFAADLTTQEGGLTMSKPKDEATVDQTAIDAARAEGLAAGKAEGTQNERTRISAIMGLDESKTRRESAVNLALNTDMTVDQAKAFLATVPETAEPVAAAKPNAFEAAMNKSEHPNLGAVDGDAPEQSASDRILANYATAGGMVPKKA